MSTSAGQPAITWYQFVLVILPFFVTTMGTAVWFTTQAEERADRRISENSRTLLSLQSDLNAIKIEMSQVRGLLNDMHEQRRREWESDRKLKPFEKR